MLKNWLVDLGTTTPNLRSIKSINNPPFFQEQERTAINVHKQQSRKDSFGIVGLPLYGNIFRNAGRFQNFKSLTAKHF